MNLYPTILTDSLETFIQQLDWCAESGAVDTVQVDIMDGYFVDNITVAPLDISVVDFGNLQIDLHLQVEEPLDFVLEAAALKNVLPIRAVVAQVERMSFQDAYLSEVRRQGWKAGLALDLHTPVEAIDLASWDSIDLIQVMTIEAGAQGRAFEPRALEKCREVTELRSTLPKETELLVDGGIKANSDQLAQLQEAGVTGVAVGSALWTAADPVKAIREFAQLL